MKIRTLFHPRNDIKFWCKMRELQNASLRENCISEVDCRGDATALGIYAGTRVCGWSRIDCQVTLQGNGAKKEGCGKEAWVGMGQRAGGITREHGKSGKHSPIEKGTKENNENGARRCEKRNEKNEDGETKREENEKRKFCSLKIALMRERKRRSTRPKSKSTQFSIQ